jgi:Chaperone of endosialidase
MNPLIQCKTTTLPLLVAMLACFGLLPGAQAVIPPPDGGYPGGNTAEGQAALLSLTTGGFNTAVGWLALRSNTENGFNTAVGAGALLANISAANTATGAGALLSTTVGGNNTANGVFALFSNTTGQSNTATGAGALLSNTTANVNTATGFHALFSNTTGAANTAIGESALVGNTSGGSNTAIGSGALQNNTAGGGNTALGIAAGSAVTTAGNVICIGTPGANVSSSCYINNIWNQPGGSQAVYVNSDGKLGAQVSSRRFKEEIKPVDKASEAIYALKPVSFRYKAEIEPMRPLGFGLIAEDVEAVNPDLVVRDNEGKPYTVRYDQVNAMLLNEFLKEHRKVQELEANVARQQKQIEALTAGLQSVSAQLELSKPGPQTVLNGQ